MIAELVDAGHRDKREGENRRGGGDQEDDERGAVDDGVELGEHDAVSGPIVLRRSEWVDRHAVPMPMINMPASIFDQMNIE
jgi:hypothetical protein